MGVRLNVTEAFKLLFMRQGKMQKDISKELGLGTPANLANMINRGSIRVRVGAAVVEACGYKMMLVPKEVEIEDGIEIKGEVDKE